MALLLILFYVKMCHVATNISKNDMRQEEWDVLKSNIQEYFI